MVNSHEASVAIGSATVVTSDGNGAGVRYIGVTTPRIDGVHLFPKGPGETSLR